MFFNNKLHRLHTEWQWPISGVHSIMMEKSALAKDCERCTRSKLQCTLQLRGQIPSPYLSSTPICTLCVEQWLKRYLFSRKLKSRYGARNRFNARDRVWNWVAKLHRLAGRYDNPMPTWFLAPIAGLKLPTLFSKKYQKVIMWWKVLKLLSLLTTNALPYNFVKYFIQKCF